jgi:hypothetical protein
MATSWLREAVAPLSAGIAWERRCAPSQTPAISRIDVEAAFLLVVPLLDLPADLSGRCRLSVEMRSGGDLEYAGVVVEVEDGKLVSCTARLRREAEAWASGTPLDWFGWANGSDAERLELGGDTSLALALASSLRHVLTPGDRV